MDNLRSTPRSVTTAAQDGNPGERTNQLAEHSTVHQVSPAKIALITWSLPGGGVEIYLLRLGRFLASCGHQVDIITTESPGEWFPRITELGLGAIHIDGYDHPASSPLWHARKVGRYLAGHGYDVVFINGSRTAQAALALLPDEIAAIPILHADLDYNYQNFLIYPRAWNAVIGVSPRIREVAQALVPDRPILALANGVDMPSAEQWEGRSPWRQPFDILYVGRLEDIQKGIRFLPPIIHGCVERGIDLRFTVIGDGPDRAMFEQQIDAYGLRERTRFCGFLPAQDVYSYLLHAHVFILTSLYEGLPTVVLEASACGCVSIASRLSGITDVAIADGETGLLVDIGNTDGFVSAIERLYRDPELWTRMSRAAHALMVREFSVEAMGERYQEVLADLQAGRYPLPGKRWLVHALDRRRWYPSYWLTQGVMNFLRKIHGFLPRILQLVWRLLRIVKKSILRPVWRR